MKNLSGKELLRGDAIIAQIADGVVQVGTVAEFYDRNNQIRVAGYPIRINAADTVLAQDAWNAFAIPLLEKRKADAEAAKAALKASQTAPNPPPSVPTPESTPGASNPTPSGTQSP